MNVALICSGYYHLFAIKILEELIKSNVPVKAVIVAKRTRKINIKVIKNKLWKFKKTILSIGVNNYLKMFFKSGYEKHKRKRELKSRISIFDYTRTNRIATFKLTAINSITCANLIKKLKIDILINGGAGIYDRSIIDIKNLLILNGHWGILPYYRGINVIEWAFLNGDKLGATVHLIDRGIDTGDILITEELNLVSCNSIGDLRLQGYNFTAKLLAKSIKGLLEKKLFFISQKKSGKYWHTMHPKLIKILQNKLQLRI